MLLKIIIWVSLLFKTDHFFQMKKSLQVEVRVQLVSLCRMHWAGKLYVIVAGDGGHGQGTPCELELSHLWRGSSKKASSL